MDMGQHEDFLLLLKTFADEQRLKMVGYMVDREQTVTALAVSLNLSEPTVSHHIGKLHSAGLLRLRMAGNQRFYQINTQRLAQFKGYVADMEQIPLPQPSKKDETAWIEALSWASADDKKVLKDYTEGGRLAQLPTKEKKLFTVLRWLSTLFERDKHYTEKEVNAIITPIHSDYATLRRSLVEYGFMRREKGGGDYWLALDEG